MQKPLILIIDDEQSILNALNDSLTEEGFRVKTSTNPLDAIPMIGELIPDLLILDIAMPHINGIDLLVKVKKEYPQQNVIIISGFGTISVALDAIKKGALDFIEKPLNLDDLISKTNFLKVIKTSHKGAPHKKTSLSNIIGESYLFQELIDHAKKIASLNLPVLIYGKKGTGKSLLANYIHENSTLFQHHFLVYNCEIEDSLEKKLSSFKEGSFYIKNIDLMSLEDQKKVLTFITKNHTVRLIASSRKSLYKLLKNNLFSETLFYKLNSTPIEIPPLQKRQYDIPLLVNYFLSKENKKHDKSIMFSAAAIRLLRNLAWPGNVSQLKEFIEKLVLLTPQQHHIFCPTELNEYIQEKDLQLIEEQSFTNFSSLKEATLAFEKHFLLYHLKKSHYDLNQVSNKLHLNIPQLHAKMLELNIELNT